MLRFVGIICENSCNNNLVSFKRSIFIMSSSHRDDFEQIFEELEEYQEPEEELSSPVRHIQDPNGSPGLITIPDVLGWVLAFFILFIIYTGVTAAYSTFSYYADKVTTFFVGDSAKNNFESPATVAASDEGRVENDVELSRIEKRLGSIGIGPGAEELEEDEESDEPEARSGSAPKKKKRFSIREFFGKTVSKDISKNRDKVFTIGDRSALETPEAKKPRKKKRKKRKRRSRRKARAEEVVEEVNDSKIRF